MQEEFRQKEIEEKRLELISNEIRDFIDNKFEEMVSVALSFKQETLDQEDIKERLVKSFESFLNFKENTYKAKYRLEFKSYLERDFPNDVVEYNMRLREEIRQQLLEFKRQERLKKKEKLKALTFFLKSLVALFIVGIVIAIVFIVLNLSKLELNMLLINYYFILPIMLFLRLWD